MPPPLPLPKQIFFSTFNVTSQVFHTSPTRLSHALVNLRPLLPGHILIIPSTHHKRLSSLSAPEIADLFSTTQRVGQMVERVFGAEGLNIAVQDGKAAGQTVPWVHVHVLPRGGVGERERVERGREEGGGGEEVMGGDWVHRALEEGEAGWRADERDGDEREGERRGTFPVVDERERRDRSLEEMEREARWLRAEMEREGTESGDP
ncbi:MAG: hypothetical protein M1817_006181 [Caeruleum heppii]|nr:MAG: hypothetical protein M1817_006181 [Caeruleum heppii]